MIRAFAEVTEYDLATPSGGLGFPLVVRITEGEHKGLEVYLPVKPTKAAKREAFRLVGMIALVEFNPSNVCDPSARIIPVDREHGTAT